MSYHKFILTGWHSDVFLPASTLIKKSEPLINQLTNCGRKDIFDRHSGFSSGGVYLITNPLESFFDFIKPQNSSVSPFGPLNRPK